jgi:arginine repressor
MTMQAGVIQGTAKQIRAALDAMSDDEIVRFIVGRPSLSVIARKLQNEVATRGITDAQYNELMASLKTD